MHQPHKITAILAMACALLVSAPAQVHGQADPDETEKSRVRDARNRELAEFWREFEGQRKAIYALNAESLAKLKANDRLLYLAYVEGIGVIGGPGEEPTGLRDLVNQDLERRGMEGANLVARIFRDEPIVPIREYIFRWLEWRFTFPAAPILEEARRLYWNEGGKWNSTMQGLFARGLAARGLAADMAILEDLQKQRGKDWFQGPVQLLQKRIRLGEERGDATGELPLIPEATSATVEPTPLPPFGQTESPQPPATKPTNPPATSTATAPPLPANNSASPLIPIAMGTAILAALLLWWRLRRR